MPGFVNHAVLAQHIVGDIECGHYRNLFGTMNIAAALDLAHILIEVLSRFNQCLLVGRRAIDLIFFVQDLHLHRSILFIHVVTPKFISETL